MAAPEAIPYNEFVIRIATALLGGILIGLERERAQVSRTKEHATIPGLRSFGLLSVYGGLTSSLSLIYQDVNPGTTGLVFGASALGLLIFLGVYAYMRMVRERVFGITTYIVLLIAYFVGLLAGIGLILEAASVSVITTLILAAKDPASRLAKSISYDEIIAIMEIGVLALVAGPIIRAYSQLVPWIDLYKVYIFFIIVLGLTFASYVAARIWGARGVLYSTILGSLVNSEAMMGNVTRIIGRMPGPEDSRASTLNSFTPLIIGVMQARASLLSIIALYLFAVTLSPAAVAGFVFLALIAIILVLVSTKRAAGALGVELDVRSPLDWYTALRSAVAYLLLTAAATILASLGVRWETMILLGFLGGLVNATAAILSMASVASSVGPVVSASSMLAAIGAATFNKLLYSELEALTGRERSSIVFWSFSLALPPLALSLILLL